MNSNFSTVLTLDIVFVRLNGIKVSQFYAKMGFWVVPINSKEKGFKP